MEGVGYVYSEKQTQTIMTTATKIIEIAAIAVNNEMDAWVKQHQAHFPLPALKKVTEDAIEKRKTSKGTSEIRKQMDLAVLENKLQAINRAMYAGSSTTKAIVNGEL